MHLHQKILSRPVQLTDIDKFSLQKFGCLAIRVIHENEKFSRKVKNGTS